LAKVETRTGWYWHLYYDLIDWFQSPKFFLCSVCIFSACFVFCWRSENSATVLSTAKLCQRRLKDSQQFLKFRR
jgi:hypothetical protein